MVEGRVSALFLSWAATPVSTPVAAPVKIFMEYRVDRKDFLVVDLSHIANASSVCFGVGKFTRHTSYSFFCVFLFSSSFFLIGGAGVT